MLNLIDHTRDPALLFATRVVLLDMHPRPSNSLSLLAIELDRVLIMHVFV